jgi:hypothetical protein
LILIANGIDLFRDDANIASICPADFFPEPDSVCIAAEDEQVAFLNSNQKSPSAMLAPVILLRGFHRFKGL